MIRRLLFVAGLVFASFFMFAGPASAQGYPGTPTTIAPTTAPGPTTVSATGLARTGSSSSFPTAAVGIGLVTAGAVALGISRRRHHSKTA